MMFYSDEDLDFYEHEIDLTALKKRQEEQAKKEEQERERLQEEQRKKEARQTRRRTWARRLTGLAAALAVSVTSVASYDWLVAKPRIEELETQRDEMQTQLQELSGSASVSGVSSVVYGNELTVPQIIAKARPSVVAISTVSGWSTGTGSGVIMTEDGTIMTNAHVVSGAQSITVRVMDGTEYEATLLGMDEKTDLAVIKIDATGLTPAEFGDSSSIVQGEIAVAIGNPLGLAFEGSVTQGIISAVSREIEVDGRTMTYIQTDAAINPGNSGGALVNGSGQVIGINSVKVSSSDVEGLGFAIPISVALPIAEQLTTYGYVTGRPSIGIGGEDVTDYMVYYYRIPRGVLVGLVTPDSGAEAGGVEVGDVIVGLNGVSVSSMDELTNEKDKFSPGDTVTLTVYRSGEYVELDVVLGESTGG
ncbi:MAG TPA: trypsin-like peptidase domain-containing protein [Candidatus Galloscillospira excrementipullorum]|nr:trypsin-like peptidase domain-containing protein [Candidatus Galloscillospira excrementipullorum]